MASTTVNFNLKTAGYVNYANQTLTFRLLTAGAEASTGDQSYVTLPGVVTATSAANGDGSVSLFRNGKSGIESIYEVILPNREKAKFVIPSGSATIELAALLVDHVPGGSNVQQSSVYAEAIKRANHTGTQLLSTISDGTEGVQDIVGGMVTGNTETGITVTYEDSDGTLDFVVASQTDQNFTTALKNKLDGIAGSTTEEIQDIAGPLVATGGTKTGIAVTYDDANNNMDFVVASQTDENFTTADHSKLDGIEASANVTDTANVTSAGALMDSEVDADIKTLSLPASTTINDFARTSLLNSNATSIKSALGVADTSAIAGFVPNSITFPATSAFLSIANQTDLNVGTGDFTLSFWARLDSDGTQPVLDKFSGTGYSLKFSSGSLVLTMQDAGGPLTCTFGTALDDNKWHVYVVSVDRDGNAVAYIDNVAQTALPVTSVDATLDNTTVFRIGFDGSNAGSGIALGNYVALHKSALTASQAAQVYFSADAALTAVVPTLMVDLRKADKTFTDVSASPLPVITNGTVKFNQDRITSLDGVGDINCSSISADVAATGLNVIFDGTDTGDNKITLTDNLASALDITESTNSYLKFTTTNSGEKVVLGKDLDISGDHDLIIGTSTGTKIGTAATQKIGFFNAAPVVQQNTTGTTTGFAEGSGGTAAKSVSTFTGGVGSTTYTVGDIVKALKQLGLLAE